MLLNCFVTVCGQDSAGPLRNIENRKKKKQCEGIEAHLRKSRRSNQSLITAVDIEYFFYLTEVGSVGFSDFGGLFLKSNQKII